MARHPAALPLRFLQTVVEIAAENNSTTLFPVPIELFSGLMEQHRGKSPAGSLPATESTESDEPAQLGSGKHEQMARLVEQVLGLERAPTRVPSGDESV